MNQNRTGPNTLFKQLPPEMMSPCPSGHHASSAPMEHRVAVIDSHTGGEPTRVIIKGGPQLGPGSLVQQRQHFATNFDDFRSAVVNEPRGSDILVGAYLLEPQDPTCAAGVIFFNNVGTLGMCGHGMIGLVVTLAHMGRIGPGEHRIETPVGTVTTRLESGGQVSVINVPSYRKYKAVTIDVPRIGPVTGDIAWGGNWFFLSQHSPLSINLDHLEPLTDFSWSLRQAVNAQGYPQVDHVELFGPPTRSEAHAKNFVLCPGKAYDRSPCGTGTSAKLACLAADGKLAEAETWVQESITGSTFTGSYTWDQDDRIIPTITGQAFVCAESTLVLNENDPLCWGLRH